MDNKYEKIVAKKRNYIERVFFMDLGDFPGNFGTNVEYFLAPFQKVGKA